MRIFAVAALCILSACATPVALYAPVAAPGGSVIDQAGAPITVSVAEGSRVAVRPPSGDSAYRRPVFLVAVANNSSQTIDLDPSQIMARTSDGRTLDVVTAEQLRSEASRNDAMLRAAASVQATDSTIRSQNLRRLDANTGAAQMAVDAQRVVANQNAVSASNAGVEAELRATEANGGTFTHVAIAPGSSYLVPVTLQRVPADAAGVVMMVTVGADVHEFQWAYSKQ